MTTWNPSGIIIYREYKVEDWRTQEWKLHKKFAKKRENWEWFRLTKKDIDTIDKIFWRETVIEEINFWVIDMPWSNFYYRACSSWIESFNLCIWCNVYPLSYLEQLTWKKYMTIKTWLLECTQRWLVELLNKEVVEKVFSIWSRYTMLKPNWIDLMIQDNAPVKIWYLYNWITLTFVWGESFAITINVNPKYN